MANEKVFSPKKYVYENIFWVLISGFWYYKLLFRCIPGMSADNSKLLLLTLVVVTLLAGVLITRGKYRSRLSIFANVVFPFGIYTIIAYRMYIRIETWVAMIVGIGFSLLYTVMLLSHRKAKSTPLKTVLLKRFVQATSITHAILSFCFMLLVAYVGVSSCFGIFAFASATKAESNSELEEFSIANNIEIIAQLDETVWHGLPPKSKLNVLQTVANCLSYNQGLPHELNVTAASLEGNVVACYDDNRHTIILDFEHLECDTAHSVLDSLCHEVRHALQHRLCDLLDNVSDDQKNLCIFREIKEFQNEFNHYVDGKTDTYEYYQQACESDAREFAYVCVGNIYFEIRQFMTEGALN